MIQRIKIDLTFQVILKTPAAVGSGFRRGQIQRTVVRGLDGLPYIPASTLKGRCRDAAVRLANTLGLRVCDDPDPENMCWSKLTDVQDKQESLCVICRTFGSPGISSLSGYTGLIWRDAKLCDEQGKPVKVKGNGISEDETSPDAFYYSRTNVSLSRMRGVALEKRLFTSENTLENLRFRARIRGWLTTAPTEQEFPSELILLMSSLKLLNFLGGGKSRGLGNCEIVFSQPLFLNDQEVEPQKVLEAISILQNQGGR